MDVIDFINIMIFMDIDSVRTYLAVAATGGFAMAAERMNVTQSTVSIRIANLEEKLGYKLFWRNRAGARLTPTGERFLDHAREMVRIWEQARGITEKPGDLHSRFYVGCQPMLWERLARPLVSWARKTLPGMALKLETGTSEWMVGELLAGQIDLALMQETPVQATLEGRKIFEEELVLVMRGGKNAGPGAKGYIHIDWGADFADQHRDYYKSQGAHPLWMNDASMALDYLMQNGGSAFLPLVSVRGLISGGELKRVRLRRSFTRPIYAVYSQKYENDIVRRSVTRLRKIAKA